MEPTPEKAAQPSPPPGPPIDRASRVRPGEELAIEPLFAYLRGVLGPPPDAADEAAALSVQQFPGGYSNLTYLVRYGSRELVLRRPPFGSKVKSAHDMGREHRILSKLCGPYPRVPRPLCYCPDESVLGAPFYVMERLRGIILRREPPPGLTLDEARMRDLCRSFLDTLIELHAIDYGAIGLGDLGQPEGYVQRQVSGWSKRYRDAQTDDVPAMDEVMTWLAAHIPTSPPATLLHNDFKFDNLVLDPQDLHVMGLLDWEMATLGDPLMDLGTALCYWVEASDPAEMQEARFGPTNRPGALTRSELAKEYGERTGRDLTNIVFYYCFGLFKTAVVVQQIYFRFKQGLTKDPRFATLGHMAAVLATQARSAVENNRI